MGRLIFHVDANSAYLSWEAARRIRQGFDDLRLIPSAIGGDKEKRTGVILASSIPAKKCGVKTGEPLGMALRKCPDLVLARPDFRLYEQCSRAFMDICRDFAPVVEKYSIDECFLDMTGTKYIYPDPIKTANDIKNKIRDDLGFTVNIGVGSNKLLAKTASDFEKPDRVHTLFIDEIEKKLWPMPVRKLFGVGSVTAKKLDKIYIKTIGDLAKTDLALLQSIVGNKPGLQIHRFANGLDDSPVLAQAEDAKGYSISTTLEKDVKSSTEAYKVFLSLADSLATRMRADGAKAYCVGINIRSHDFKDKTRQQKLAEPTDITSEIYELSKSLFDKLWDKKTPLRLLGISLMDITRGEIRQLSLFNDKDKEKAEKVDKAVDKIRSKYGFDTIKRGTSLKSKLDVGKRHKAELGGETGKKS